MASKTGTRTTQKKGTSARSAGGRKTPARKTASTRNSSAGRGNGGSGIGNEIILIVILAAAILLFLCNFGVIGPAGDAVSGVLFGLFGKMAYAAPVLIFLAIAFGMANRGTGIAEMKLAAGVVLFFLFGIVFELVSGGLKGMESYQAAELYRMGSQERSGGGVICGSAAYLLYHFLDTIGTVLVVIVLAIICAVIVTEKSFVSGVKKGGRRVYETAVEESERRRERAERRREELALQREQEEQERILRMDKKVSGVMLDTTLEREPKAAGGSRVRDDIHEIVLNEEEDAESVTLQAEPVLDFNAVNITLAGSVQDAEAAGAPDVSDALYRTGVSLSAAGDGLQEILIPEPRTEFTPAWEPEIREISGALAELTGELEAESMGFSGPPAEEATLQEEETAAGVKPRGGKSRSDRPGTVTSEKKRAAALPEEASGEEALKISTETSPAPKRYHFPPLNLLHKSDTRGDAGAARELKQTAARLQQTLGTFGVKVTITDISQGPSVTRYELQPEPGVKVSRIVNLTDDIKLNLAATDIRIEAPIPGKSAVGIEVPNKENSPVALRDLLERKEFKDFPSNLAFAVGKDIGGQTVVSDIAKMPHMLIAGATGSGKSVCINTLIMSILYKAHPDDVKLIMVDPKVVELSVYNGIPHLLIPVVTDPKKAAGALHWGVAEMEDRYKRFADLNVRDLKGYNKKMAEKRKKGDPDAEANMPQIVIIVDELADLMMVAPGEVEESICRLAQLARAAGIHLIIATQRPSVDVITGLIKANMPSRVAFAVSSGVDSRTILDMNGAEKLLGKGDMLFYPQGYPKPARIQGAFVSDKEVSDVVDFLKNQAIGNVYSEAVEEKIQSIGSQPSGSFEKDDYFVEAGKFIIEKDKASIGMLQRVFKIGFNRAARIMDQLSEAGVVGEEEGTKPRKVLMSQEEFENYIEEYL